VSGSQTRGSTLAVAIAAIAAIAAMAGAASGCNLIVGSGDYVVDAAVGGGDDVTQTKPGDGSDGGTTGSEGGTQADVGAPDASTVLPDGGSPSLEAGSTVACGVDGGGAGAGTASFQQLITACVMAESCDPAYFDVPLSECITEDYLEAFPSTACLASAKTCQDFYNCTGNRVADLTDCDGSNFNDTGLCSTNGVATTCFGAVGGGLIYNCGVLGGTCTPYATDTSGDMAANCTVLPSCPDTSKGFHCASTTQIYECDSTSTSTIAVGAACPTASSCQTNTEGTHCIYNSPSCATPGATCLDGNLNLCTSSASGNQGATFRCAVAGLSCAADADAGTGACVAPGCANTTCQESCDSTTGIMTACIGGSPFAIDCIKYGFTTCSTGSPSSSTTTYAFCEF